MAQFRIEIPRGYVAAVARFMAKNDIRYYLNGALLEVHANTARLVAADGYTLACARITRNGENMDGQGSAIIPRKLLEKIKAKGNNSMPVVFHVDGENVTVEDCGARMSQSAIEGKFPDFSKVCPRKVSGEVAHYNPDYLMRCKKAAEDVGIGKLGAFNFGYNGTGPALVTFDGSDVFAVIMPMRSDSAETAPDWLDENPEAFGRLTIDEAWNDYAGRDRVADVAEAWELAESEDSRHGFTFEPVALAA